MSVMTTRRRPTNAVRMLGLDLSLTSTGWCSGLGDFVEHGTFRPGDKIRGPERLCFLRDHLQRLVTKSFPAAAIIEGYAMGAKGRVFDIGEWGGVARVALYELGIPVYIVPPSTLKQFVTNKGNADKALMKKFVSQRWGFSAKTDDEVDAFALYRFGLQFTLPSHGTVYWAEDKVKLIPGRRVS